MIDKEFVPYQESLELKELGFDEPCFGMYNRDKKLFIISPTNQTSFEFLCTPTFSQAFRWFREKCELYSCINNFTEELGNKKVYFIYEIRNPEQFELSETYNTYEEAELACLRKLIEIVKSK
jgi:hypothetical protein